jgi:hypothetical protein
MSTTELMRVRYTPDGDTVRCLRVLAANGISRTEPVAVAECTAMTERTPT